MKKTRIALAVYFLIGLILVSIATFLLVNYIKRWAIIHQQRCVTSQTEQEISEYKRLGFSDNEELIQLLHGRIHRAQKKIDDITHKWLVVHLHNPLNETAKHNIQNIVSINKKMLMGYIKDIKEYKKLGITNSHPIISFAHDKIIRLTIALAELERQLNGGTRNSSNEYTQRVSRMYQINQQSIEQFKHELEKHVQAGIEELDPKLVFVRRQLTRKTRALQQLDGILAD